MSSSGGSEPCRMENKSSAAELLCITESAIELLNRSRYAGPSQQPASAFGRVHTTSRPACDDEAASSHSSTVSEVLKRSTNVANVRPHTFQPSRGVSVTGNKSLVRVPANILREIRSPLEPCSPLNVSLDVSDAKSDLTAPQHCRPLTSVNGYHQHGSAAINKQKRDAALNNRYTVTREKDFSKTAIDRPRPSPRDTQPVVTDIVRSYPGHVDGNSEGTHQIGSSEGKKIHPLMAMLDSGYLTQPIHTIIAEERASTGSGSGSLVCSTSPIDVLAKDAPMSPSATGDSSCSSSTQPEIITIPDRTVPVLPTAELAHNLAPSIDSSDTDQYPAKPFIALKDRFLKFRPVNVKQGTETTTDSTRVQSAGLQPASDELQIEQFGLDEKHRQLRQAFTSRKTSTSVPVKRLVPAHVIPIPSSTDAAANHGQHTTTAAATAPDNVASAAIAAVVATQTFMKSQQDLESRIDEVLKKMAELQSLSQQQSLNKPKSPVPDAAATKYSKKLELLESQLADLTRQRLDYLEKLHQQQLDVQMQLLALTRQSTAANHARSRTCDSPQLPAWARAASNDAAAARPSKSEGALLHDVEHEKGSLLDTPAPRKRPPVPTTCEPNTVHVSNGLQPTSDRPLLAEIIASQEETPKKNKHPSVGPSLVGRQNLLQGSTSTSSADELESRRNAPNLKHTVHKSTNKNNDTFSLTPEKRTPLDKYLEMTAMPLIGSSPYPTLKAARASHMPALLQYAEAEAILKKVQATGAQLETNIDMVLRSRKDHDDCGDQMSLAEKIRVRKLVDERIQATIGQLEKEIEEEQRTAEELKKQQVMVPERDTSRPKKPLGFLDRRQQIAKGRAGVPVTGRSQADKENVPKITKIKKPRPLDPVEDEEYMKRVYGRALYHKQRSAQQEACKRYHASPKSKLPQTPVKVSRAVVKGIETATTKTQTSAAVDPHHMPVGGAALPSQFVLGLHGELIPVAIPVRLPKSTSPIHLSPGRTKSPPRRTSPVRRSPSPDQPSDASEEPEDKEEEEEEVKDESENENEEQRAISLPGHTAPPLNYEGPEFPVRSMPAMPDSRPAQMSSDNLAENIRRTDHLQNEVIDWVEQELMARIISEMYEKRSHDLLPHSRVSADVSQASSEGDVGDSLTADVVGPSGVQLFVDAGRPVDDALVRALVREVLAEKISAMLSEKMELDRLPGRMAATQQPVRQVVDDVAAVRDMKSHMHRSPVPTPEPTPEPTPVCTPSEGASRVTTPEISAAVPLVQHLPIAAPEEEQHVDDNDEFPSYTGVSESDHNIESDHRESPPPFVERHDFNTPSVTPSASPTPSVHTPSLSHEEPLPRPAEIVEQPRIPPQELPAVTTTDASVECKMSTPERVSPEPEPSRAPSPPSVSESPVLTTEVSSTNNECMSEGQWVVSLLSEGEVPDMEMNDLLKQRIRQHLINASKRPHKSEEEEDTLGIVDELDEEDKSEAMPSEGEIHLPMRPLSEHVALLSSFLPSRIPVASHRDRDASPVRHPMSARHPSIGEVSTGQVETRGYGNSFAAPNGSQHHRDLETKQSRHSSADSATGLQLSVGEYRPGGPLKSQQKPTSPELPSGDAERQPNHKKTGQQRPMPGRVMSTADPSLGQSTKRQPNFSATRTLEIPRSESPLQPSAAAGNRFIIETGNTLSDVPSRTMTPDQMNTDALLQSRNYLRQSDVFGSTGYSDGEFAGSGVLRSTLQKTGDSVPENAVSGRSGDDGRNIMGSRGSMTEDELRATFSVQRPKVITIPTTNQSEDMASETEVEVSSILSGQ